MKKVLLIMILGLMLSFSYSQCDANGDGELDILDVIEEVNCILNNCWNQELSESILGYWLVDQMNGEIYIDGQLSEQSYFCEDEGVYVFLMFFGEDNEGEFIEVTESNCGLSEVDISNPIDVIQWQYEFNDDNTMEFLGNIWTIINISDENLTIEYTQYFENHPFDYESQKVTYQLNKVSVIRN